MPYSIIVSFQAQADAVIPRNTGHYAHALFFDGLLKPHHPKVYKRVHDEDPKPFTLSPLMGPFREQHSGLGITEGETYRIRITFLEPRILKYFQHAAQNAAGEILRIDKAPFKIREILAAPESSPLCARRSFKDIFSKAQLNRRIGLAFVSPTTFRSGKTMIRSGNRRNVLVPEPRLLFNSYLIRWQKFSSITLEPDILSVVESKTWIAPPKRETRALNFVGYTETGFTGTCIIEIADDVTENAVRSLNALADFAFFCGTGAKTAMGMGQTRRWEFRE